MAASSANRVLPLPLSGSRVNPAGHRVGSSAGNAWSLWRGGRTLHGEEARMKAPTAKERRAPQMNGRRAS
jgi:hypothetical protein